MRLGNGAVDRRVRFNGAIISLDESKLLIQRNRRSMGLSLEHQEIHNCSHCDLPQ